MRRPVLVLLLATGLALACAGKSEAPAPELPGASLPVLLPEPTRPAQVLLISVEGLTAAAYDTPAQGAPWMPLLAAMAEAGAWAEGLEPVVPANLAPAHTTLVTGRRPASHGIVANAPIGDRGVREGAVLHASAVIGPTLWSSAREAGQRVASLGWPVTTGAAIDQLLPDLSAAPGRLDVMVQLADASTPALFATFRSVSGGDSRALAPGAIRDAAYVSVACSLMASPETPRLLLLHLSGPGVASHRFGPGSPHTRAAFAAADAELGRLVDCLRDAGRLEVAAFVVAGDRGLLPVHSAVRPNALLAEAGLLTRMPENAGLSEWRALVRSNGGTAFVYARDEASAVQARRLLDTSAARDGVFEVLTAEAMLELGGDPKAWFGLVAPPGYVFEDSASLPRVVASLRRGAGGYLGEDPRLRPGLVVWGAGVRGGVRMPWLRQIDVAPTVARLLGIALPEAEGSAPVGALRLSADRR